MAGFPATFRMLVATGWLAGAAAPALSQTDRPALPMPVPALSETIRFDIPAQPLDQALRKLPGGSCHCRSTNARSSSTNAERWPGKPGPM